VARAVSAATVLRLLREDGLLLEANYQRESRQLAARRKAAFAVERTGPNQVWQLDFTEFETTSGGMWRLASCRDYRSKYELGWHISPTANQHDAIAAVQLALAEAERIAGARLLDLAPRDEDGNAAPLITTVARCSPTSPVWGRAEPKRRCRLGSQPVLAPTQGRWRRCSYWLMAWPISRTIADAEMDSSGRSPAVSRPLASPRANSPRISIRCMTDQRSAWAVPLYIRHSTR
jgi:hypothetical protein